MTPASALQAFVGELFPLQRGPVNVEVHIRPMLRAWSNDFTIEAIAQSPVGFGRAFVLLDAQSIAVGKTNKNAFVHFLEKSLFRCVDRALTEHLVDHETQQGWPPRDCLHNRMEHELEERLK